jgi:flagellar basal body-associated protein FliL
MKKKLMILGPVLLIVVGLGYKMFLAPKPIPPKLKIEGSLVALQKDFLVNLAEGQYAKLAIAVVMDPHAAAGGGHGAADAALGLPQEAAVRAIILDELTGINGEELISRVGRHELLEKIAKTIKKKTDEHVEEVLFTDITVQ